jgi:hypothetical protein
VGLLTDKDVHVRSKAALAINAIAITTPGKYSCIKAGAIPNVIPLIDDDLSEMRVNALKVLKIMISSF